MLNLREHPGSTPIVLVVSMLLIILGFCVLFCFICFLFEADVAYVSGLSILEFFFDFLSGLFNLIYDHGCNI